MRLRYFCAQIRIFERTNLVTNETHLTQRKAAAYLGVTYQTLSRYRKSGYFNPLELPNLVLYARHELDNFIEGRKAGKFKGIHRKEVVR